MQAFRRVRIVRIPDVQIDRQLPELVGLETGILLLPAQKDLFRDADLAELGQQ